MIFVTGDMHRDFSRVARFCKKMGTSKEKDMLIILGEAGLNYCGDQRDVYAKREAEKLPIKLFCIHGNHEQRPETYRFSAVSIEHSGMSEGKPVYTETERYGGTVYVEPEFPNILFAKCGEIYVIGGKKCLAIGGAYSIDKTRRIRESLGWWPNEQPDEAIKKRTEKALDGAGWKTDIVLSHTCPIKYTPHEAFLKGYDQSLVDKSTEIWLDKIEDRLEYGKWLCGHFHINKNTGKMRFLADSIEIL